MKVLIVKLSSLGDCIHTLPSLYAIRKGFEKAGKSITIDWLVEEASAPILEGNSMIDELIVVKKRGWTKNFSQSRQTAKRLVAKRYDAVLDFQGLMKSAVWVSRAKGARRIGFSNAREMSTVFYSEKVKVYDPEMHAVDRYLLLAKHLLSSITKDIGKVVFPLDIDEKTEAEMESLLDSVGIGPNMPFVAVAPRARWKTKLWPVKNFAELSRDLYRMYNFKVVLVGSPNDYDYLESIKTRAGRDTVNLAGKTSLKELICILRRSSAIVTVDSGPMHLAVAAGCRVVALFGPTAPGRTGPYGEGHTILRTGIDCSPCFKRECSDTKCMDEIRVDDVLRAVGESIDIEISRLRKSV